MHWCFACLAPIMRVSRVPEPPVTLLAYRMTLFTLDIRVLGTLALGTRDEDQICIFYYIIIPELSTLFYLELTKEPIKMLGVQILMETYLILFNLLYIYMCISIWIYWYKDTDKYTYIVEIYRCTVYENICMHLSVYLTGNYPNVHQCVDGEINCLISMQWTTSQQ